MCGTTLPLRAVPTDRYSGTIWAIFSANPQIVKKLASNDIEGSQSLLLASTRFSYYLMLLLCLPICLVAKELLEIWLSVVPDYTVDFVQLTIITSMFQVFDTSFYTALYAKGRIKENALICPTLGILVFPIVWVMFKYNYSPICLAWALMVHYAINGLLVKPLLINKIAGYSWKGIFTVYSDCLKVTIWAIPLPLVFNYYCRMYFNNIYIVLLSVSLFSIMSVSLVVWYVGLNKEMRNKVIYTIRKKLKNE